MHLPFLGSSERLWITLKMVWSLKKESTYNLALWENPFNMMETNMVPYKRIFISIFPNGEKLEITLISDHQNWLIYGGRTRQCSRHIVKWRDSTVWLGQNHRTLRISSHTEQKPWKKIFFQCFNHSYLWTVGLSIILFHFTFSLIFAFSEWNVEYFADCIREFWRISQLS